MSGNSNFTRVQTFGTPSAFDPINIHQSRTGSDTKENTINACVSLKNLTSTNANAYSLQLDLGTIPGKTIITSVTFNGSQSLPVGIVVQLFLREGTNNTPLAITSSISSTPPSKPNENLNGSQTIITNTILPAGNYTLFLGVSGAGLPVPPADGLTEGIVNVTVKYIL